jgi:hypothetical protein
VIQKGCLLVPKRWPVLRIGRTDASLVPTKLVALTSLKTRNFVPLVPTNDQNSVHEHEPTVLSLPRLGKLPRLYWEYIRACRFSLSETGISPFPWPALQSTGRGWATTSLGRRHSLNLWSSGPVESCVPCDHCGRWDGYKEKTFI